MNIRFVCPVCEQPGRLDLPASAAWQCPACDHLVPAPSLPADGQVHTCLVCGNHEIYRQKDFPHSLGMAILVLSCLASAVTYYLRYIVLTWGILIGSALFDGLLYLSVGDVSVCYRCGARYRGFPVNPEHKPFELTIGERYRQERLRLERMKDEG